MLLTVNDSRTGMLTLDKTKAITLQQRFIPPKNVDLECQDLKSNFYWFPFWGKQTDFELVSSYSEVSLLIDVVQETTIPEFKFALN